MDKPAGVSSHDVVAVARRALREKRIGHAGTLDPFATGLLILLLGRATRLMRYVQDEPLDWGVAADRPLEDRTRLVDEAGLDEAHRLSGVLLGPFDAASAIAALSHGALNLSGTGTATLSLTFKDGGILVGAKSLSLGGPR